MLFISIVVCGLFDYVCIFFKYVCEVMCGVFVVFLGFFIVLIYKVFFWLLGVVCIGIF